MPKMLYTLRCAPCYNSNILSEYDLVIHNTLQSIMNVNLTDDAWSQATLPVSSGGLGIRLANDLALPSFLSSTAGSAALCLELLPSRLHSSSATEDSLYITASLQWQSRSGTTVPEQSMAGIQKAWDKDKPLVAKKSELVLSAAQTQAGRARLIAAAAPHSGDFLHAFPAHQSALA